MLAYANQPELMKQCGKDAGVQRQHDHGCTYIPFTAFVLRCQHG